MPNEIYRQSITDLDTIRVTAGYPNYPDGSYHGGMDTVIGNSQVYAPRAGTVVRAHHWQGGTDPSTADAWGNYILVEYGPDKYWLAAHFASQIHTVGDVLAKGQFIGTQGATGNVTGPHTHWEYWNGGESTAYRADPEIVLHIPSVVGRYNVVWNGEEPPHSGGGRFPIWLFKKIKDRRRIT